MRTASKNQYEDRRRLFLWSPGRLTLNGSLLLLFFVVILFCFFGSEPEKAWALIDVEGLDFSLRFLTSSC